MSEKTYDGFVISWRGDEEPDPWPGGQGYPGDPQGDALSRLILPG